MTTLPATRVVSVACRSIPRPDGNGADGCGAGWTQAVDAPLVCPRCRRGLHVTDTYLEAPLDPRRLDPATPPTRGK